MANLNQKIGFLGAGRMATALARGILSAGLAGVDQLMASDPSAEQRERFQKETGIKITASNLEVAQLCSTVILAVKPNHAGEVLEEIRKFFGSKLLVSIAAGVSISHLETHLDERARVVRCMPNTPSLVCQGAAGFALGQNATQEDRSLVEQILQAVGMAVCLPEKLLDAVTGLSGSGPAYLFLTIEALSDGGVEMGLPRDISTRLAAQTMLGAAQMVLSTGRHPGELKDMVTSPGGTTIEGLHALEQGGVRASLMNAVRVATEKSKKLGAHK